MRCSGEPKGGAVGGGRGPAALLRAAGILLLALAGVLAWASPERRKVRVGINRDYPPYEYLDPKGNPAGHDVDLLRAVAEVENLDLAFQADVWDGTVAAFREGRLDMLAGLLHSPAREAMADFSAPHLVVHYTLFVRRGDLRIRGEEDLPGHRILVERGSQMHDHLRGMGGKLQLIPVASEPEAIRRLAAGEGDAALAPQLLGIVQAKQERLPIQPVGGPVFTRQLCFATRKGEGELLSKLNTGLAILNQTGRYAEIYQARFGGLLPDPGAGQALARRALVVLGLVAVVLVLVAVWNASLRRQVAQATEQLRRANQEIRGNEAYLDSVIANLPVAIFAKDPRRDFAFTLWNARSEQIFGLRKDEVMGKTDYDFFPKEQADHFREKDLEVIREGKTMDIPLEPIHSRSLGPISLQTRKVPLFDPEGRPVLLLGISENITDRLSMEEGLRQAQKLESLGVLAGGIAHDFNNLLTAILGNLGLAALHAAEGDPSLPYLQSAETTALRASELTRQLLAYAGKGVFVVKPIDLSHAAEEMASLLKVSISKKATLRFQFAQGLPQVMADPAHLQQVVMNLVTNASEAIGESAGQILVATELTELDEAQIAALHPGSPIPPGRYATLCVKDDGVGMSPEVLSRMFDPFFTTKFSGRGLGMSSILGILRAHGAGIGIRSAPGQGAEFRIHFPVREGEDPAARTSCEAEDALPGMQGLLLLVEDESEVREVAASMLRKTGFEVLEAADGVEAVQHYQANPGAFRAVLMDLTMPRMDGRAAAREILALDPGARIILTSGFPNDQEADHRGLEKLAGFLQKPYQTRDLLAALRRALAPPAEGAAPSTPP